MAQAQPGAPEWRVGPVRPFEEFRQDDVEQSVTERFEEQVARYPDHLAVKSHRHEYNYRQLNARANQIAKAILDRVGLDPRDHTVADAEPVGVLLESDAPAIAVILGILKAGGAYVPLEPSLPRDRLAHLVQDSTARLVVTDHEHRASAEAVVPPACQLLNVDEIDRTLPVENLGLEISPDTVAYILYTSGSTGQPKGVYNNHRNVLQHILRITNSYHLRTDDRVASVRSFSFSGTVKDIFGALLNGASVWPFNIGERGIEEMAPWLVESRITNYVSVATTYRQLMTTLSPESSFPDLRVVHIGGEPVHWRDLDSYKTHLPPGCLFGLGLGITETGNVTQIFFNKETPWEGSDVPAGYPVPGMEVLILDEAGRELAPGQVGQIAVRSQYLVLGYWRRPELTKDSFLPDPAGGPTRIYLTGDLGYVRADGCLFCLGRMDNQFKHLGHRIEPLEVEKVLLGHTGIGEVVVAPQSFPSGAHRLVAYFVPTGQQVPTVSELRKFLATKLPFQMIPSVFVQVDRMSLTLSGKLNRWDLPEPGTSRPNLETPFVPARTPTEKQISAIWAEVMEWERVGIYDDFFELGGNSLLATQIVSRVRAAFGVQVPLGALFEGPTVAQLSAIVEEAQNRGAVIEEPSLLRLSREKFRLE
jgi:amino acid adenylation domain-containing protein